MKKKKSTQKEYNALSEARAQEVFNNTLQASQSNLSRLFKYSHETEGRLLKWDYEELVWRNMGMYKSVWHVPDVYGLEPLALYRTVDAPHTGPKVPSTHHKGFAFSSVRCGGRLSPRTKSGSGWVVKGQDGELTRFASQAQVAEHFDIKVLTVKRWAKERPHVIYRCGFTPIVNEDGTSLVITEAKSKPKRRRKK